MHLIANNKRPQNYKSKSLSITPNPCGSPSKKSTSPQAYKTHISRNLRGCDTWRALSQEWSQQLCNDIIPQQRKLGVFSHSKGSGAGRSSQIRWEPGSGEGSGEEFPFTGEFLGAARSARRKVGNRVPSKRFPSKVPRNRFPSNGS